MKTLLVYYSLEESTTQLCESCADDAHFDTYAIHERYFCSDSTQICRALAGQGVKIEKNDIDFTQYGSIILATSLISGRLAPAFNEFLHTNNLLNMPVSCLILHGGKTLPKSIHSVLRKRISLAGGVYKDLVAIPLREVRSKEKSYESVAKKLKRCSLNSKSTVFSHGAFFCVYFKMCKEYALNVQPFSPNINVQSVSNMKRHLYM